MMDKIELGRWFVIIGVGLFDIYALYYLFFEMLGGKI